MSNIMRRLKKLERRVADGPAHVDVNGKPPMRQARRASSPALSRWNTSRTVLLLVLGIALGVLGYLAGMKSHLGGSTTDDHRNTGDASTVAKVPVVNKPDEETSVVSGDDTGDAEKGDLSTLVFEEEPILPSKLPANTNTPQAGGSSNKLALNQDRPLPGIDSGDSGIDGERIVVLTTAILRATDEPLSVEEDEKNKDDIRGMKILGVVEEQEGTVAIISGTSVREGDQFRQFMVDEIGSNYVVLSYKGKLYRKFAR